MNGAFARLWASKTAKSGPPLAAKGSAESASEHRLPTAPFDLFRNPR